MRRICGVVVALNISCTRRCAFRVKHSSCVLRRTTNVTRVTIVFDFLSVTTQTRRAVQTFVVVACVSPDTAADRMAERPEVAAACAPAVESPDADAVELCGRFVSELFKRFRTKGQPDCCCRATPITFADKLMARSFDRLFDMMSHDLLRAADGDARARPPPQLRLYDDLGEFTLLCSPLHEINRHAPPPVSVLHS